MTGKKNIVFGLIYLVFTAALGPYMLKTHFGDFGQAASERQSAMAELAQIQRDGYEKDLDPVDAMTLAKLNTEALLASNRADMTRAPIDSIKGGPHAHGNLEALLNIVAGLVLLFLAAPGLLKEAASWIFILGALLHSGLLYLRAFDVAWAGKLLATGIGPVLILLGLLLLGVMALLYLKPAPVKE